MQKPGERQAQGIGEDTGAPCGQIRRWKEGRRRLVRSAVAGPAGPRLRHGCAG